MGTSHHTYATDFGFIPLPKRLRYDPDKPFHFGNLLHVSFGFASAFVVANLYYCQPLLIKFSESFNVSYDEVSRIPTLAQAGYATGLLLVSPLGDLLRRRQLLLCLLILSSSFTIGLAVTDNAIVFQALTFLVGVSSVTPQVLIPLAADLAPPERRASAISVVFSGLLLGILMARVLAGVIAELTTWRVVYYLAIGLQLFILCGCYLLVPDYPAKNEDMTYLNILFTMAKYAVTEPILIQACLIVIGFSACFSNFWVTLTFLLSDPPYQYSTLIIGLFGLIGMFGVALVPLFGRLIDRLVPWFASLIAILLLICFQSIQLGAGGIQVAAPIIACIGIDLFSQMLQVSLSTNVIGISVAARSRLNAVFVLSLFIGQVVGTSVGSKVFIRYGWRAGAALSMGWYAWQLFILLMRGPHCERYTWFGYEGGIEYRKNVITERRRRATDGDVVTEDVSKVERADGNDGEKKDRQSQRPHTVPKALLVGDSIVRMRINWYQIMTGDVSAKRRSLHLLATIGKRTLIYAFLTGKNVFHQRIFRSQSDMLGPVERPVEGTEVELEISHVNASEVYSRMRTLYLRADVILVGFAIDDLESFINVTSLWVPEIRQHRPDVPIILVGYKGDRRKNRTASFSPYCCCVPTSEARALAASIGAWDYAECSVTDSESVKMVFKSTAAVCASLEPRPKDSTCIVC